MLYFYYAQPNRFGLLMSTIFITIPAYEDPLLIETIEGALKNARYPENLHFAIALTYDVEPSLDQYVDNFKYIRYQKESRPALNMIRHELFNLYSGEDYLLMIDSHTLFAPNWDTDLILDHFQLKNIYGKKTVISKQVPHLVGPISILNEKTMWEIDLGNDKGFLHKLWAEVKPYKQNAGYYLVNHASGHFLFAPGNFVTEVGILPVQGHYAQEEMISYISFMNGWSIFARSDYHHIGHNHQPYNQALYAKDSLGKDQKSWGIQQDSEETIKEIENLLLYNTGRYQIKTNRTPLDFYKAMSIEKEYLQLLRGTQNA
jgi:hypothetical protein